jgi:hypothetical protein
MTMTNTIHQGMKVFAGRDAIGTVTAVRDKEIEVTRGLVFRHVYVIPRRYVAEAAQDVVDLSIDKRTVDGLESTSDSEPAPLPDEFKNVEGVNDSPPSAFRDPRDDIRLRW